MGENKDEKNLKYRRIFDDAIEAPENPEELKIWWKEFLGEDK